MDTSTSPNGTAFAQQPAGPTLAPPQLAPVSDALSPDEQINVAVYELANRSVVNISTLTVRPDRWLLRPVPSEGNGSGSVLDESGHILTNYHVIEDARQVVVTLFNEESYPAKLVGADPINDIAVIKIRSPCRTTVSDRDRQFGCSESRPAGLRAGQSVRSATHDEHRHHCQFEPFARSGRQLDHQVNHPDRCLDQPRLVPAGRCSTRADG